MRRDTKLGVQLTVFEEVDVDQRVEVFDTALGHIRASGWTVLPGPCERMPAVSGTELMTEFRWPVTRAVCGLCDQPFGPDDVDATPPGTDDVVHMCCWYGGCEHPRTATGSSPRKDG